MIVENSVGFKLRNNQPQWCTRCFVYILVTAEVPGRYYLSTYAYNLEPLLYKQLNYEKTVLAQTTECYQYYITGADNDLYVYADIFQGNVILMAIGRSTPKSLTDTSIAIKSESQGFDRIMVVQSSLRTQVGYKTGLWYICAYAFDDASFRLHLDEHGTSTKLRALTGVQYTFRIAANSFVWYTYNVGELDTAGNITLNFTSNVAEIQMYYMIC